MSGEFQLACSEGRLGDAHRIASRHEFRIATLSRENLALRLACAGGHLVVAQWLHSTYGHADSRHIGELLLYTALKHGHLDVAKWVYAAFNMEAAFGAAGKNRVDFAIQFARSGEHKSAMWIREAEEWILDRVPRDDPLFGADHTNAQFQLACALGELEIAKKIHTSIWMTDGGDNFAFRHACAGETPEHFEVAKWFHATHARSQEDARDAFKSCLASSFGAPVSLETAQWLRATFDLTSADLDVETVRNVLQIPNAPMHDFVYQLFEMDDTDLTACSTWIAALLYDPARRNYEEARARVRRARQAAQDRIKPAWRSCSTSAALLNKPHT